MRMNALPFGFVRPAARALLLVTLAVQPLWAQDAVKSSIADQQDVRQHTSVLADQIQGLVDELTENGIAGDDIKVLNTTKAVLGNLSAQEMQRVIESLQGASANQGTQKGEQKLVEAYGAQKSVIEQFRQILKDYEQRQAADELPAKFKELTDRETQVMWTTAQVATEIAGKNQAEMSTMQQTTAQIAQTDQNALTNDVAMAKQMLDKAAKDSTGDQGRAMQQAQKDLADGKLQDALSKASDDLNAGHLLQATTEQKAARDMLRQLSKDLNPPTTTADALAGFAATLTKIIEQQKDLLTQTNASVDIKPRVTGLDSKEAMIVDQTNSLQEDMLTLSPDVSAMVKAAIPPMQTARAALGLHGGSFAKAAESEQDAIDKLQAAALQLNKQVADAQKAADDAAKDSTQKLQDLQNQIAQAQQAQKATTQQTAQATSNSDAGALAQAQQAQAQLAQAAQQMQQAAAPVSLPTSQALANAATAMQQAQQAIQQAQQTPSAAANQAAASAQQQAQQALAQASQAAQQALAQSQQQATDPSQLASAANQLQQAQNSVASAAAAAQQAQQSASSPSASSPSASSPSASSPSASSPSASSPSASSPSASSPSASSPSASSPSASSPSASSPSASSASASSPSASSPSASSPSASSPSAASAMQQAQQALAQAAQATQAAAATPGLPDATQSAVQSAQQDIAQGQQAAAQGNAAGTASAAAAAQSALAQAQAAVAVAQAGMSPGSSSASASGPPGSGPPGPPGPPGSGPPTPSMTPGMPGSTPTPPVPFSASMDGAQIISGGETDAGALHDVAGNGKFITVQSRVRTAISETQAEPRPQEYSPMIDQYLKNLSDQATTSSAQ